MSLIINSKTCIIENKPPSSANSSTTTATSLASTKSNFKKRDKIPLNKNDTKTNETIKIEGKNLNANTVEDLNDYTSALALAHDLINLHPKLEDTTSSSSKVGLAASKKKIKPIAKSSQVQKEPNSIPIKSQLPQIPQIEVKGNKINEFASSHSANSNLSLLATNLNRLDLRDELLFDKTLDVYNIPGFLKPYQLSKPKTSNPKTSDFNTNTYGDSDEEEEEDNDCDDINNAYSDLNEAINQLEPENIYSTNNNQNDITSSNDTNSLLDQQQQQRQQKQKSQNKQKLRSYHPPLLNKNKKQLLDKKPEQVLPLVTGMPCIEVASSKTDSQNST